MKPNKHYIHIIVRIPQEQQLLCSNSLRRIHLSVSKSCSIPHELLHLHGCMQYSSTVTLSVWLYAAFPISYFIYMAAYSILHQLRCLHGCMQYSPPIILSVWLVVLHLFQRPFRCSYLHERSMVYRTHNIQSWNLHQKLYPIVSCQKNKFKILIPPMWNWLK